MHIFSSIPFLDSFRKYFQASFHFSAWFCVQKDIFRIQFSSFHIFYSLIVNLLCTLPFFWVQNIFKNSLIFNQAQYAFDLVERLKTTDENFIVALLKLNGKWKRCRRHEIEFGTKILGIKKCNMNNNKTLLEESKRLHKSLWMKLIKKFI